MGHREKAGKLGGWEALEFGRRKAEKGEAGRPGGNGAARRLIKLTRLNEPGEIRFTDTNVYCTG